MRKITRKLVQAYALHLGFSEVGACPLKFAAGRRLRGDVTHPDGGATIFSDGRILYPSEIGYMRSLGMDFVHVYQRHELREPSPLKAAGKLARLVIPGRTRQQYKALARYYS